MKELFVVYPADDLTEAEIKAANKKIKKVSEALTGFKIDILNGSSRYTKEYSEDVKNTRVFDLSESIKMMSCADYIVVMGNFLGYTRCDIEKWIAETFEIKLIHIDPKYAFGNWNDILKRNFDGETCCSEEENG